MLGTVVITLRPFEAAVRAVAGPGLACVAGRVTVRGGLGVVRPAGFGCQSARMRRR